MVGRWIFGCVVGVVLILGLGFANSLLIEGKFAQAYEQGIKTGGLGGLLLAARAANHAASYASKGDAEAQGWFNRAADAAQKALQINPRSAEAHFEIARSQGGTLLKQNVLNRLGTAASMRDHLNDALRYKPDLVEAKVALAVWNYEVADSGVGWIYGASKDRVKPLFEEAVQLDPASVVVRVWYGGTVLKMGDIQTARLQFEKAVSLTPKDAVDRIEQSYAKERLQALK